MPSHDFHQFDVQCFVIPRIFRMYFRIDYDDPAVFEIGLFQPNEV